jgi:hypothetical protein
MSRYLAIVAMIVSCANAFAGFLSLEDLKGDLREVEKMEKGDRSADMARVHRAMSYVAGVADALHDGKSICLPQDLELRNLAAIVRTDWRFVPEALIGKVSASVAVQETLKKKLPCKK